MGLMLIELSVDTAAKLEAVRLITHPAAIRCAARSCSRVVLERGLDPA